MVSQNSHTSIDKTEVVVNNFKGDTGLKGIVEIRGIVNKDNKTLSFGQLTHFGDSFGKLFLTLNLCRPKRLRENDEILPRDVKKAHYLTIISTKK
jgi:hypothetical protein